MKVSACVITKNEEKNLATCLQSVKAVATEIIVVDTGSTDKTIAIADGFGAQVYQCQWKNDFSHARNFALSKAKGDWIIFLDADEYFTPETIGKLPGVLREAKRKQADLIIGMLSNYEQTTKVMLNMSASIRIFRNSSKIRYAGAIHEMLQRSDKPAVHMDATQSIHIIHTGYSIDEMKEKNKGHRNIEILLAEFEKNPTSSNICFYLTEAYMNIGNFEQALIYGYKTIEYKNGTFLGIYEKNYSNIIHCNLELKAPLLELIKIATEANKKYPNFPDFYFHLGDFYRYQGRYHDVIEIYNKGLFQLRNAGNAETQVYFKLARIMGALGQLYYQTSQLGESVKCYVESLKSDRYYYESLEDILFILSRHETKEDMIGFFAKIFNYADAKDVLYLLKASLRTGNLDLAEYYLHRLSQEQQQQLPAEVAYIQLLKKDYYGAAIALERLVADSLDNRQAVQCIIAAALGGEDGILNRLTGLVNPGLKRIIERVRGFDAVLLDSDKAEVLTLLNEYIRLAVVNQIDNLMPWMLETDVLLDTAEVALHYEKYNMAIDLFNSYLQREAEVADEKLADILLKMGECSFKLDNLELAFQFILDTKKIIPMNYRIYELAFAICAKARDRQNLVLIAEEAAQHFSDSNYVTSVLNG